jgi:hypothetical protein
MHLVMIGGSDAGISAALRARELDPAPHSPDEHYPAGPDRQAVRAEMERARIFRPAGSFPPRRRYAGGGPYLARRPEMVRRMR